MKKWQPPIPAGALCSPDAITINSALPLLGWCYDQVGRDGWLEINLHEVAADIHVEYWTIKRWWSLLRKSSFIADHKEHGRGGMRVRLADQWIDWRQLNNRETGANMRPNSNDEEVIGTETGAEMIPNSDNRDIIGTETGANMRPNTSGNKVLIDSDQAERERRVKRAAPTPKKPKTEKAHDPTLDHLAVITYRATFKRTPNADQRQAITMAVTDNDLWSEICALWKQNRWDYLKVENLINRYQKGNGNGSTNGRIRSHSRQPVENAQWRESTDDEPV